MNIGGGLTGLVGSGGPGGAFSPQAQQDQQKKRVLAQLFQAIQQSKQQQGQQGQGAPSALPGSPGGQGGAPTLPNLPGGQAPSPAQGGPSGGPAGGLPNMDQMIQQLVASPGNNATKMQALEQYGAFASPFEKMQQQLTMQQSKIEAASQRLADQMQNMRDLQAMRNQQSGANNAANNATKERGQDISSTNTDKRVGAIERGQDMRADTSAAALEEKQRHETTMENIASDKTKNQAARDSLRQKEIDRHNLATEALGSEKADTAQYVANTGAAKASEQGRHNTVTEGQGQQKVNTGQQRANTYQQTADTGRERAVEQGRHNTVTEGQGQQRADTYQQNADTAAAVLAEKNRHQTTMENIDNDKAKNQAWRDKLKQEEVDRHNLAIEGIGQEKADTGQYVANTGRERAVETGRHNTVTEGQGQQKVNTGAQRANTYQQTADTGTARAAEQGRHNTVTEGQGQQRADTYERGVASGSATRQQNADTAGGRLAETGRHNKITEGQGQQRADAATENASTNKFSAIAKDKQGQQKIALEIQKMKSKVPPQNNKPFKAAEDTYRQAAALYNKVAGPQYNGVPSDEHAVQIAKDAMDRAQDTMNKLATLPSGITAADITPENLEHTAKVNGITVDEVKKRLGVQ